MDQKKYSEEQINAAISVMKEIFNKNPSIDEGRSINKWIDTTQVAGAMKLPVKDTRLLLLQMEKEGLLHSHKTINYINWAVNSIEGFSPSKINTNYYTKTTSNT